MNQNENRNMVRLNKYLASCGLGSRRACDSLIGSGRIYVNGTKVNELGTKVTMGKDRVEYLGRTLEPVLSLRYIAFHKPHGIMVTKSDPEGRETVFDALKKAGCDAGGMNYVGQLDVASEGILLLTNDGSLIHALTHPRYQIKKTYDVQCDRNLPPGVAEAMTGPGMESEGDVLRAGAVIETGRDGRFWYRVEIYKGKKRQIRRMFEAAGCAVLRLRRVQFASVKLGDLAPGAFRDLTVREVASLRAAGFPPSSISR
jgi:23S rRNA pseudouridine2605 synthase